MKIAIRTDASREIGTGHVMRCLTLSDRFRSTGAEVRFLCRPFEGNLIAFIEKRGYPVHVLPASSPDAKTETDGNLPPHYAWLGTSLKADAVDCIDALGSYVPDWLIVDHYAIDRRWERDMRTHCRKIMVVDDLADRFHDCDVLLDQSLGRVSDDYRGLVPSDCKIAAGADYALLRDEFTELREYSLNRRRNAEVSNILITMGGVDKDDATSKVMDALQTCEMPEGVTLTIVMGGQAPWLSLVRAKAGELPWPAKVIVDTHDMARLMSESDIAIGAAGATSWERCCLGLPSIIVVLAENQTLIASSLESAGAARSIGDINQLNSLLAPALDPLIGSAAKRLAMIDACAAITDGHGTSRVLAFMEL